MVSTVIFLIDFTDIIITILYHIFLRYFCLSDVLMMAHIILYCSKRYKVIDLVIVTFKDIKE